PDRGKKPSPKAVAPLDLAQKGLAVLGVADGARRDQENPLSGPPLGFAAVVRERVSDARDGHWKQAATRVHAFAKPGDLDMLRDLVDLAVLDVGDEQAGRVRALIDGCHTHIDGYPSALFLFRDKTEMVEPAEPLAGGE